MNLLTQVWIIVLSVCIIIYLFEKIRKQKYFVKFSMPWFFTFFIIIILAVFPHLIDVIARALGINEPTNAIFFIAICILVNNIINISLSISEAKKHSIEMAQEIALLKKDILNMNDEITDKYKLVREIAILDNTETNNKS
jgi:hypothetical protein